MRLEFGFQLSDVEIPRFSVEAVEGIGKLFTLATLVLNVLDNKPKVEIVFHGLNPEDPDRKIEAFHTIINSSSLELGAPGERQRHRPEPHRDLALEVVLVDDFGQLRTRHTGHDALDIHQQHRRRVNVIHRDIKEPLDLIRMQINR